MILNLRPKNLGLLDCIVEEIDERFPEEQQEDILRIVGEILGEDEEILIGEGEGEGREVDVAEVADREDVTMEEG